MKNHISGFAKYLGLIFSLHFRQLGDENSLVHNEFANEFNQFPVTFKNYEVISCSQCQAWYNSNSTFFYIYKKALSRTQQGILTDSLL